MATTAPAATKAEKPKKAPPTVAQRQKELTALIKLGEGLPAKIQKATHALQLAKDREAAAKKSKSGKSKKS
jgi:hypothetical protein